MEIRVIASIWGSEFADVFVRWSLPSLLSQGNQKNVVAQGHRISFYVYSDTANLECIRASASNASLDREEFKLLDIAATLFKGKPLDAGVKSPEGLIDTHELQSRCYMHGMEQKLDGEVVFLFWTAEIKNFIS